MLFFEVGSTFVVDFESVLLVVLFVGGVISIGFFAGLVPACCGFGVLPLIFFFAEKVLGGQFGLNLNGVAVFGERGLFVDSFFGSRLDAELLFDE